jgi:CubicO group peptidase (beta-lactamase class C family)
MTDIGGSVEPGFEAVADAFRSSFERHGEVGAATSVYVGGRKVVDLWGGVADVATGAPYTEDTLQLVFSTTKGATAACANLLAQRGDLDLDAPVAEYWPEFKANGKGDIPVRWLLCHKAGLPYVDTRLTLEEALAWDPMIRALEDQAPLWEPGTAHGYHATTYGWLVGEVVRRITGKSLGTFWRDEIAAPLDLEFWIGLPDDQQARVAPLIQWGSLSDAASAVDDPEMKKLIEQFIGPESMLGKALGAPNNVLSDAEGGFNNPAVRAAEIPAANGVTNARSLARFYAGLTGTVDGGPAEPILTEDQVAKASELQTSGPDKCLYMETTFGLGFFVASIFAP